ncbi:MAG: hypothetical protein ACO2OU_04165 [Thermus aquaticus]|uniref:hypothetical protein n=1 Tax=Thermus aquaticus TaxID=271 RepID=UPI003C06C0EF
MTLVSTSGNVTLIPRREPTLDLSLAATLAGPGSTVVLGDRLYEPSLLRVPCVYVGDLTSVLAHYMALVRAVRTATELRYTVSGTTYTRNLIAGGEIRPRGGKLAPRLEYELVLIPSGPFWTGPGGSPVALWW